MTQHRVLTAAGIVLGAFGVGFLVVPGLVLGIYGISVGAGGTMLVHVAGAAILGLAAIAWLCRNLPADLLGRTISPAFMVWFTAKAVVTIIAQVQGVFNALGWTIVLIDAAFLAAFASAMVMSRAKELQAHG